MPDQPGADAPPAADPRPPDVDLSSANAALVTAIAEAMAEAGEVRKDRENTEHRYKFASVEAMLEAVRLPLLSRGVILLARPGRVDTSEIQAKSGTRGERVEVSFDFEFAGHGASLQIHGWTGVGVDYSDKAYSKAVTSALKTFVRAQWLLPALTDEGDGDQVSPPYGSRAGAASGLHAADEQALEQMLGVVTRLVGGHRPTAEQYVELLSAKIGGAVPAVVAAWLTSLPRWRDAGLQALEREAAALAEPEPERGADPIAGTDAPASAAERREPPADQFAGPTEPVCGKSYRGSANVVCVLKPGHAWPQHVTEGGQTFDDDVARDAPAEPQPRLTDPEAAHAPEPEQAPAEDEPAAGTVDPPPGNPGADAPEPEREAYLDELRQAGCVCADPFTETGREDGCPIKGHGIPF